MTDRETLLAACLDQPADDTARLVYADLLREQDSPVGRFLWAGVTLARFRGQVVEDGMFFDAQKELNAVGLAVIGGQLKALFGWELPDVLWDQDGAAADRLTATHIPRRTAADTERSTRTRNLPRVKKLFPAAFYERGMLCGLRLTLDAWRERHAGLVLKSCPLERVEVLDVPGLTLRLTGPEGGWRMVGSLDLPRRRGELLMPGTAYTNRSPGRPAANLCVIEPALSLDPVGLTRPHLVEQIETVTVIVLDGLRTRAGERWPGPGPDGDVDDVIFAAGTIDEQIAAPNAEDTDGPIDSEDM